MQAVPIQIDMDPGSLHGTGLPYRPYPANYTGLARAKLRTVDFRTAAQRLPSLEPYRFR